MIVIPGRNNSGPSTGVVLILRLSSDGDLLLLCLACAV